MIRTVLLGALSFTLAYYFFDIKEYVWPEDNRVLVMGQPVGKKVESGLERDYKRLLSAIKNISVDQDSNIKLLITHANQVIQNVEHGSRWVPTSSPGTFLFVSKANLNIVDRTLMIHRYQYINTKLTPIPGGFFSSEKARQRYDTSVDYIEIALDDISNLYVSQNKYGASELNIETSNLGYNNKHCFFVSELTMSRGRDITRKYDKYASISYQPTAPNCKKDWSIEDVNRNFVDRVVKHQIQGQSVVYRIAVSDKISAVKLMSYLGGVI